MQKHCLGRNDLKIKNGYDTSYFFSMTRFLITQTTYNYERLLTNNNNYGFIVTNYNDAPNGTGNLELGTHPDEKLLDDHLQQYQRFT